MGKGIEAKEGGDERDTAAQQSRKSTKPAVLADMGLRRSLTGEEEERKKI